MKKLLFIVILLSVGITQAQLLNFGLKGGMNFNSNGDLTTIDGFEQDLKISSDDQTGYHIGALAEIKLPLFLYVRPELLFTHTKSKYTENNYDSDLTLNKIDIPVLIGLRFLKIGRIFAGPVFSYIQKVDLKSTDVFDEVKKISSDDFSTGMQLGAGLEFGKFGGDIRWEKGFSDTTAEFLGKISDGGIGYDQDAKVRVDTRQQQFIISIYYKFL